MFYVLTLLLRPKSRKSRRLQKQNKADKWLKILEDHYRRDITKRIRETGYDPSPQEVETALAREVRHKGRHDLRDMIAALPVFNGEKPPQNLTIKEGRSVIFDAWKKDRAMPGRKAGGGQHT